MISVVIPTRNRAPYLRRLLQALDRQTEGDFEVVIVDDASTDETPSILRAWSGPNRLVLRQDQPLGSYAARNRGWRRARGDLIAFTDDDCVPHPTWLAALSQAVDEPKTVGVQGQTFARPGAVTPFTHQIEQHRGGPPYRTANILYRRSELERQDGFQDDLRWYADNIFGLRARRYGTVAFAPDAIVDHPPRQREWRTQSEWLERFRADAAHRRVLHELGVEPAIVRGAALPVMLWVVRPMIKQSLAHWRFALHEPVRYTREVQPMLREKAAMLLALRDYWREQHPPPWMARNPDSPSPSEWNAVSTGQWGEGPRVTVAVVTRNRPALLAGTLNALSRQTWPRMETLVVDNGQGEARSTAAQFGARYVDAAGKTLGGARQSALDHAVGDIVAFTDDDCVPRLTWVRALVEALLAHPQWRGVQGRTDSEQGPVGTHAISIQTPSPLFHTCNIAYWRVVLEDVGGFDAGFDGWFEDTALGARVLTHGPIGWEPRAVVLHRAMPRIFFDRSEWTRVLRDEHRLASLYPTFYRATRARSFLAAVVFRWLLGSPIKTLLRALPWFTRERHGYLRLAGMLLRERFDLLRAVASRQWRDPTVQRVRPVHPEARPRETIVPEP